MLIPDVNVLIYAFHEESSTRHGEYRARLEDLVNGQQAYGMSEHVLSGFCRIVTNQRVFTVSATMESALTFAGQVRSGTGHVPVRPGPRHWDIFTDLCLSVGARGNTVPDAYVAALVIEVGAEFVTIDRGFARYPGLRWRHPLEAG